jgi:hypothetical protein
MCYVYKSGGWEVRNALAERAAQLGGPAPCLSTLVTIGSGA